MSKVFGYVISLIGVGILLISLKPIKATIPFFTNVPDPALWGIGAIVIVIGVFSLRKSRGGKQPSEVPIYHGKNVVGFRRMGKR